MRCVCTTVSERKCPKRTRSALSAILLVTGRSLRSMWRGRIPKRKPYAITSIMAVTVTIQFLSTIMAISRFRWDKSARLDAGVRQKQNSARYKRTVCKDWLQGRRYRRNSIDWSNIPNMQIGGVEAYLVAVREMAAPHANVVKAVGSKVAGSGSWSLVALPGWCSPRVRLCKREWELPRLRRGSDVNDSGPPGQYRCREKGICAGTWSEWKSGDDFKVSSRVTTNKGGRLRVRSNREGTSRAGCST